MSHDASSFLMRFWGVRGSLPVPGPNTLRYGGNTTCIEIEAGGHIVIIDCGSGAYGLGRDLIRRNIREANILMTHAHLDHVIGFPFFKPAYDGNFALRCTYARIQNAEPMEDVLRSLVGDALTPVGHIALSNCSFNRFEPGSDFEIAPGLIVRTQLLNHPGGAVGYRLEYGGGAVAMIFDHEHGDPEIDAAVRHFVKKADVMVYDAAFSDAEYLSHAGWGHSTWEQAIKLGEAANVGTTVLFHHLPERTDVELDEILALARQRWPSTCVAQEGITIEISV